MLKGGSWLSPHPLNLRVLDLCMQDPRLADGSVGFRVFMDEPPGLAAPQEAARPTLRLAKDLPAALREARERRVPLFLSLLHDTCGQCDRTIAQVYRDPEFVRFCNERLVVVVGHHPADAGDDPHPPREDGSCPVHEGLTCREHVRLYNEGLRIVGGFPVSPGNFVLDPFEVGGRYLGPASGDVTIRHADLVPPESLPKGGAAVAPFLAAFEEAARLLAERRAGR
jgi:hypothetical protein